MMKSYLCMLMLCASFTCAATTCVTTDGEQFVEGEKLSSQFRFKFWPVPHKQTVMQIDLPAQLDGEQFKAMLLVKGLDDRGADGYGIYLAVSPHETEQGKLSSILNMTTYLLEGSVIALSYGDKECSVGPAYKVDKLMQDKANWR